MRVKTTQEQTFADSFINIPNSQLDTINKIIDKGKRGRYPFLRSFLASSRSFLVSIHSFFASSRSFLAILQKNQPIPCAIRH